MYQNIISDYLLLLNSSVSSWESSDLFLKEIAATMGVGLPTLKYRLKTESFKPKDLKIFYDALAELTSSKNLIDKTPTTSESERLISKGIHIGSQIPLISNGQ
jgi:hypothetical protein